MPFPFTEFILQAEKEGRSSSFIETALSYATKLEDSNYLVIFSLEHLAIMMGVQSSYIRKLISDGESFDVENPYKHRRYNYFKIPKKRGGFREIMAPSKDLKYLQKWILVNILNNYKFENSCTGFRENISIYDNAKPHANADMILKIDLLKFYDSISEKRVYHIFQEMGYAKNLAVSFARLLTSEHRASYWNSVSNKDLNILGYKRGNIPSVLPQGSPTSPALANIAATGMDKKFQNLADKLNFKYTRYADDLTFSIKSTSAKLPQLNEINKIIRQEGFGINPKKISYMKKGSKQYVTGLSTTNGINVSKKYRKNIESHIYYCRKWGVKNHLEKSRGTQLKDPSILVFHDWLFGHICFIKSINPGAASKMMSNFSKIDWV